MRPCLFQARDNCKARPPDPAPLKTLVGASLRICTGDSLAGFANDRLGQPVRASNVYPDPITHTRTDNCTPTPNLIDSALE